MNRISSTSRSALQSSARRAFSTTPIARDHFLNATQQQFNDRVSDSAASKPILVQFTATWCQPCRMLGPMLQRVTGPESKYDLMVIDVDQQPEVAAENKVTAVPFVRAFKHGKEVDKFIGLKPQAQIDALLKKLDEA